MVIEGSFQVSKVIIRWFFGLWERFARAVCHSQRATVGKKSKYCFDRILLTVFFFNEKYFKCVSSLWSLNFSEIHIPCILYNKKIANFNSPPCPHIYSWNLMKFSWQNTLFSFTYLVPFTSNHRSLIEDKWIISRRSIKGNSKKCWEKLLMTRISLSGFWRWSIYLYILFFSTSFSLCSHLFNLTSA